MSDEKLKVSADMEPTEADDLLRGLPSYYSKDKDSGNSKLLAAVGKSIERLDEDIETVHSAMRLPYAEEFSSIDRIADTVNVSRRTGESLEKYRMRTLVAFQSLTSEGTIADMFVTFAGILRGDEEQFRYQDWQLLYGEDATIAFLVPSNLVADSVLNSSDIADIAADLAPAGRAVKVQYSGTFTPVSVADYESGDYDTRRGFGTLDESGNPDSSGGTFGGLIQ